MNTYHNIYTESTLFQEKGFNGYIDTSIYTPFKTSFSNSYISEEATSPTLTTEVNTKITLPPLYNGQIIGTNNRLPSLSSILGDYLKPAPSYYGVRKANFVPRSSHRKNSFITLIGENASKRPRRRFHEVERIFKCNYPGCNKAYGALNHLNAHILGLGHGSKRTMKEYKRMLRK